MEKLLLRRIQLDVFLVYTARFEKLVELNGGKEMFAKNLDHGFKEKLIDYGNEPAFLPVHGFHYADRPGLSSY